MMQVIVVLGIKVTLESCIIRYYEWNKEELSPQSSSSENTPSAGTLAQVEYKHLYFLYTSILIDTGKY